MAKNSIRTFLTFLAVVTFGVGASGCALTAQKLSDDDARVIQQLSEIAPRDSGIEGDLTGFECWAPSENMVEENTFRVLCRLHFVENDMDRYRDMICIGDPDADPVSEYCYLWAFYSDMPVYEDQQGFSV